MIESKRSAPEMQRFHLPVGRARRVGDSNVASSNG
jgi:hypothetical protein